MNDSLIQSHAEIAKDQANIVIEDCNKITTIADAKRAYDSALKRNKSPILIIAKWCDIYVRS